MSNYLPVAPVGADSGRWKPVQRAFPEGVELLTEFGWVPFSVFYNDRFLGAPVPFKGNKRGVPGFGVKDLVWGQWECSQEFPRVGSVDPSTGDVVFVRPSRFTFFQYEGRLVHVKLRGVDMLTTAFADWWLKPKYGRGWRFVLGDDVVRNTQGNYQLLNKFNVDMYGEWSPQEYLGGAVDLRGSVSSGRLDALGSELKVFVDSPIVFFPRKSVRRKRVWDLFGFDVVDPETGRKVEVDRVRVDVPSFNVIVEPFHNVIVRRGRKDDNPRTLWVGGPVVFGDGLDKSELRVAGVLGGKDALGGSYGDLRPDFRVVGSDRLKDR